MVKVDRREFIIIVLGCLKINLRFKETEVLKKWLYKHEGITKKMKKKSKKSNKLRRLIKNMYLKIYPEKDQKFWIKLISHKKSK